MPTIYFTHLLSRNILIRYPIIRFKFLTECILIFVVRGGGESCYKSKLHTLWFIIHIGIIKTYRLILSYIISKNDISLNFKYIIYVYNNIHIILIRRLLFNQICGDYNNYIII